MNERVKTLIVDDHPLFANATRTLLEQIEELDIIGVVNNAAQCLKEVAQHAPSLVFLDYHLPDQYGTEVAARIKEQLPDTHIVIFSGIELSDIYNKLIGLKVSGILSKEASERTILNMVNCILDNHTMLPIALYHQVQLNGTPSSGAARLEEEEVVMMNLLVQGATLEQIASHIHMSKRTVDNYLRKIYNKLGVRTRTEAIQSFIKSQYIY